MSDKMNDRSGVLDKKNYMTHGGIYQGKDYLINDNVDSIVNIYQWRIGIQSNILLNYKQYKYNNYVEWKSDRIHELVYMIIRPIMCKQKLNKNLKFWTLHN